MRSKKLVSVGVLLVVSAAAFAAVPHVFQAGTPILASDMNENFDALQAALNARSADGGLVPSGVASGARLKVLQLRSADGSQLPQGVAGSTHYDSQLGVFCRAAVVNSKVRCTPALPSTGRLGLSTGALALGSAFLDAACTQPVAVDSSGALPSSVLGLVMAAPKFVLTGGGGGFDEVYTRVSGSQATASVLFELRGGGLCVDDTDCAAQSYCNTITSMCVGFDGGAGTACLAKPSAPAGGWKYYLLGAVEPEASFAELTYSLAP